MCFDFDVRRMKKLQSRRHARPHAPRRRSATRRPRPLIFEPFPSTVVNLSTNYHKSRRFACLLYFHFDICENPHPVFQERVGGGRGGGRPRAPGARGPPREPRGRPGAEGRDLSALARAAAARLGCKQGVRMLVLKKYLALRRQTLAKFQPNLDQFAQIVNFDIELCEICQTCQTYQTLSTSDKHLTTFTPSSAKCWQIISKLANFDIGECTIRAREPYFISANYSMTSQVFIFMVISAKDIDSLRFSGGFAVFSGIQ